MIHSLIDPLWPFDKHRIGGKFNLSLLTIGRVSDLDKLVDGVHTDNAEIPVPRAWNVMSF